MIPFMRKIVRYLLWRYINYNIAIQICRLTNESLTLYVELSLSALLLWMVATTEEYNKPPFLMSATYKRNKELYR